MITFETLVGIARKVADSVGLELHSVDVHPSGAMRLFTSEGKKYFEPATHEYASESELAAAILAIFRPVVEEPKTYSHVAIDVEIPLNTCHEMHLPDLAPLPEGTNLLRSDDVTTDTTQETPKAKKPGRKPKAEG